MTQGQYTHAALYKFDCENCGINSDWSEVLIVGESENDLVNNKIPEAKNAEIIGDYSGCMPINAGKCKSCGHKQSWSTSVYNLKSRIKMLSIIILTASFFGCWALPDAYELLFDDVLGIFQSDSGIFWMLIAFIGSLFIGTLLSCIVLFIVKSRAKAYGKKTTNRFKPVFDWKTDNLKSSKDKKICLSCGKSNPKFADTCLDCETQL